MISNVFFLFCLSLAVHTPEKAFWVAEQKTASKAQQLHESEKISATETSLRA